jgi:hypothetical protein
VTILREGDYSVALDDSNPLNIRLEPKSLGDLYGCVGAGGERFERELGRLAQYEYGGLILEASLSEFATARKSHRGPRSARCAPGRCANTSPSDSLMTTARPPRSRSALLEAFASRTDGRRAWASSTHALCLGGYTGPATTDKSDQGTKDKSG